MSMWHKAAVVAGVLILAGCGSHEAVRTQSAEQPVAVQQSAKNYQAQPLAQPAVNEPRPAPSRPVRSRGNVSFVSQRSTPADDRYNITLQDVRQNLIDGTAVFIDARKPDEFARSHLRGAVNVPAEQKEQFMEPVWRNVDRDQLVIVYCGGSNCHASDMVTDYLIRNGFRKVKVFKEGWNALGPARLPKDTGR